MNSSRRILDQLEHGRTVARPIATRQGRRHLVYAASVVAVAGLLAAVVIGWGTDVSPRAVVARDPVFRVVKPSAVKNGQEEQRLAAAIVNEPLQHHVSALGRTAGDNAGATRSEAGAPAARTRPARAAAVPHATSTQAASTRTVPRADSDVALLAALVAHTNGAPSALRDGAPAARPGAGGAGDSGEDAATTSAPAKGGAAGVAGGVAAGSTGAVTASDVERGVTAADALATQLKQCARLGGSEAVLCHARACTGRWGRGNACRVTTAE